MAVPFVRFMSQMKNGADEGDPLKWLELHIVFVLNGNNSKALPKRSSLEGYERQVLFKGHTELTKKKSFSGGGSNS